MKETLLDDAMSDDRSTSWDDVDKRTLGVKPEAVKVDPTEGPVIAYLIASEVLGCDIWFALDDSFHADDGQAVFYPDELPFLATKDAATLKETHKVKLMFPGSRVRQ
jgi:hypothetical protein